MQLPNVVQFTYIKFIILFTVSYLSVNSNSLWGKIWGRCLRTKYCEQLLDVERDEAQEWRKLFTDTFQDSRYLWALRTKYCKKRWT
jgi:hypothetical protein